MIDPSLGRPAGASPRCAAARGVRRRSTAALLAGALAASLSWPLAGAQPAAPPPNGNGAGSPARSIGTSLPKLETFSGLKVDAINGVHTGPGATPLTRIFRFVRLDARLRVKLTMAPLVAA